MQSFPEQLAYIGKMLFDRRLTDFSGGNISIRDGVNVYVSPRYAGAKYHWNLSPEHIVCGPVATDELLDNPSFSREGKAHLAVYRNFPDVGAIIHSHPFHVLPFCSAEKPLPPVLEGTEKFGVVPVLPWAPAHSQELANSIVDALRGKEAMIRKQAAAVLLARHGVFVAAKDIYAALDTVERLDWNAYCILSKHAIG